VAFRVEDFTDPASGKRFACARCGATDSFLDELIGEDGQKTHQCSDAGYCLDRLNSQAATHDAKEAA
jgi:alpha-D-ribose 1-methylphosphonate 5-phosphate C-P lyase